MESFKRLEGFGMTLNLNLKTARIARILKI